jgi:hypothetical protein
MAINIIRDGSAHYRRAVALAQAEIRAEAVLWSRRDVTVTAMVAWLLTRAGATAEELGAWMGASPEAATRAAEQFDARLAMGNDQAATARRRMEALARRMGVIVVTGVGSGGQRMGEIIPFPRARGGRTLEIVA